MREVVSLSKRLTPNTAPAPRCPELPCFGLIMHSFADVGSRPENIPGDHFVKSKGYIRFLHARCFSASEFREVFMTRNFKFVLVVLIIQIFFSTTNNNFPYVDMDIKQYKKYRKIKLKFDLNYDMLLFNPTCSYSIIILKGIPPMTNILFLGDFVEQCFVVV